MLKNKKLSQSQQLTIEQAISRAKKATKLGNFEEAQQSYHAILQYQPDNTVAKKGLRKLQRHIPSQEQMNALNTLYQSGQMPKTEQACRELLHTYPRSISVLNVLAAAFMGQGKPQEGVQALDKVIQLKPSDAEAYSNRSAALQELGQLEEAVRNCDKAIQLNPDYAEAYCNRGAALQKLGQNEAAVRSCDKAIQLNPDLAEAYSNRGAALQQMGQPEEAIRDCNKAIQLKPDYVDAHSTLSLALLLLGNFKDGWKEYEWRWRAKNFTSQNRNFVQPLWNGSDLDGKTILLHTEQGAGDSIQFIRYIREVAKYNGKIIIQCQKSLVLLFSGLPEIDILISHEEAVPAFDVHAPLLSLPYIFNTDISTVPADIPYLFAAEDRFISLPQLNPAELNVGIVWAGSPVHINDKNRSTSLANFLPLAAVPGIQLYSLQLGDHGKDPGKIADDSGIIDLTENIHDYADTASIIAQLDLVISVDTSIAHLAGAMGKKTWVILPFVPDFRWLLDRDDSPWYPTMRLFRQDASGNWHGVFSKMETELNKLSRLDDSS